MQPHKMLVPYLKALRKIVKYDPQLADSGDLMVEETEQSLKFPMTGQWT